MSAAFSRRLRTRKLKSEINVVPYIDVMLVLLIIFMVTAPLLNLGVDVNLPESEAKGLQSDKDPVLVTVDAAGNYTIKLPDSSPKPVDGAALVVEIRSLVATNPQIAVFVAGDAKADYETVFFAMSLVQKAGVANMSLMSKAPEEG
jgi:biopolymer transport protein TolR